METKDGLEKKKQVMEKKEKAKAKLGCGLPNKQSRGDPWRETEHLDYKWDRRPLVRAMGRALLWSC